MIPQRVIDYLERAGVSYQRLPHPRAVSAQRLAASLHTSGFIVAKAVLVLVDGAPAIAVLPAAELLDEQALAQAMGAQRARRMDESEFEPLFGDCEPGAEPPFGGLYGLPVIADDCLAEEDEIVVRAGSHEEALRLRWSEFARLERPRLADLGTLPPMRPPPPQPFANV